jgi:hypothetical protein
MAVRDPLVFFAFYPEAFESIRFVEEPSREPLCSGPIYVHQQPVESPAGVMSAAYECHGICEPSQFTSETAVDFHQRKDVFGCSPDVAALVHRCQACTQDGTGSGLNCQDVE